MDLEYFPKEATCIRYIILKSENKVITQFFKIISQRELEWYTPISAFHRCRYHQDSSMHNYCSVSVWWSHDSKVIQSKD